MRTTPLYAVLNVRPEGPESRWLGPWRLPDGREADLLLFRRQWLMLVWGNDEWAEWNTSLVRRGPDGGVMLRPRPSYVAAEVSTRGVSSAPPPDVRRAAILVAAKRAVARGLLHAD